MTALIQINVNDKEFNMCRVNRREFMEGAIEALAQYCQSCGDFYFDIGFNPEQITVGGIQ